MFAIHNLYIDIACSLAQSRKSFANVVSLLGPVIPTLIANRHSERKRRLVAAAKDAFVEYMLERGPWADETYARLSVQLELQTVLCAEYRYVDQELVLKPLN